MHEECLNEWWTDRDPLDVCDVHWPYHMKCEHVTLFAECLYIADMFTWCWACSQHVSDVFFLVTEYYGTLTFVILQMCLYCVIIATEIP
jgi:hypothetical protein